MMVPYKKRCNYDANHLRCGEMPPLKPPQYFDGSIEPDTETYNLPPPPDPLPREDELARAAAGGDLQALADLFGIYRLYFYSVVHSIAQGNPGLKDLADDSLQITFLKAAESLDRLVLPENSPGIIRQWLATILANTVRDERKRWSWSHTQPISSIPAQEQEPTENPDDIIGSQPEGSILFVRPVIDPARAALARIVANATVNRLISYTQYNDHPERNLAILRRAFVDDVPPSAIAQELDLSVATVKSVLERARKVLRREAAQGTLTSFDDLMGD